MAAPGAGSRSGFPIPRRLRPDLTTYDGLTRGGDPAICSTATRDVAGKLDATIPLTFSADESCDLGAGAASPLNDD
jgi:hypothetical protein